MWWSGQSHCARVHECEGLNQAKSSWLRWYGGTVVDRPRLPGLQSGVAVPLASDLLAKGLNVSCASVDLLDYPPTWLRECAGRVARCAYA